MALQKHSKIIQWAVRRPQTINHHWTKRHMQDLWRAHEEQVHRLWGDKDPGISLFRLPLWRCQAQAEINWLCLRTLPQHQHGVYGPNPQFKLLGIIAPSTLENSPPSPVSLQNLPNLQNLNSTYAHISNHLATIFAWLKEICVPPRTGGSLIRNRDLHQSSSTKIPLYPTCKKYTQSALLKQFQGTSFIGL